MLTLALLLSLSQTGTNEASRLGAEYFVQRSGVSWTYELGKSKGRVSISSFVDWRAHVSISLGKISGASVWRVKDGVWLEKSGLRGGDEAIILPATLTRGTRWVTAASIERGGGKKSAFEVIALEAMVELPNGQTLDNCLAVLETPVDGGDSFTHYYSQNIGKVAVQGPDGWLYRLSDFKGGSHHSD